MASEPLLNVTVNVTVNCEPPRGIVRYLFVIECDHDPIILRSHYVIIDIHRLGDGIAPSNINKHLTTIIVSVTS